LKQEIFAQVQKLVDVANARLHARVLVKQAAVLQTSSVKRQSNNCLKANILYRRSGGYFIVLAIMPKN
jgi:hypothetical protein